MLGTLHCGFRVVGYNIEPSTTCYKTKNSWVKLSIHSSVWEVYENFTNPNEKALWKHATTIVLGDPLALPHNEGMGLSF